MVTMIKLKLSSSRGEEEGTVAYNDEDKYMEKDLDKNKDLMKDNSV